MDGQNYTKAMVESGILTLIAIVLILMSIYIPVFSLVGVFIWPIPITLIYIKHGMKYSLSSLLITFIISMLTSGPLTALSLVVVFGVMGFVLGYCIKSKEPVSISILILSVTAFLCTLVSTQIFSVVMGQNIISQGIKVLTLARDSTKAMYIKMAMSKESIDTAMAAIPSPNTIMMALPALIIIYSVTIAVLSYLLTQKILKRFKYNIPQISPLSEWYIPSKISFGIILIFGISYLLMASGMENGQNYFINANLIFNYAFTINGVAFVAGFLKRKNILKPVRWIVIILCILPPIGSYIYFIGVFDYMMDYRKLDPYRRRPIK